MAERRAWWTRRAAVRLGLALAGAGGSLATASPASTSPATPTPSELPPEMRVVLHVSQEAHWPYALSNLDNLTQEWPNARLRVVVDGTAVYALQGTSDLTTALERLAAAGVALHVCPNALREHGIAAAAIPSYADTSLGGVAALVVASREGFVYVKP